MAARSIIVESIEPPVTPTEEAIARVPRAIAFRHDILPLRVLESVLTVALPDPGDLVILDQLRSATRLKIHAIAMPRNRIRDALQAAYGEGDSSSRSSDRHGTDAPAVRAVDLMFERAISSHASDIHIEPTTNDGRIRLRIDGILRDLESIPAQFFPAFVSRIKLVAGMDIADKRIPQDGRYTVKFERREIDARVSSVPTLDGEKLVIRLLDAHAQAPDITKLGMPVRLLQTYTSLVNAPWGFIVVTGPTGSGKTTTLYASLAEIDSASKNVCTVEDPVEMRVQGVAQVQVNPRAGLTFPGVLRSFMRQDPNVIMVGEMRDAETAAVAIAASLAGQLVFTTLHANDAPRTIERLIELGVSRASLAAGLSAVIAQRLVRRLCEQCRLAEVIPEHYRANLPVGSSRWWVPGGCRTCAKTGYLGRVGVYELLVVTDDIREAIASGASSVVLGIIGARNGYRSMSADGLEKVLAGETSFTELTRVVSWGT